MNKMVANGNKREYDPACANAALAYFNSYKAGDAELMSTFRAAKAFIAQYKSGAKVPADSPCLEASKLFSNSITNKPNKQTAAAMFAFTDEAVLSNMNQADGVCLKAAEAYFDAFLAGASEAKATEAAGAAFIEAAAFSRDFDPNGPCAKSAQAYMDGHL